MSEPSKTKRHEDAKAVAAVRGRLDRLKDTSEDGLPMPIMDVARRKLGREEMVEFTTRYYRHCQRVAGYDETFVRPSVAMARRAVAYLSILQSWPTTAYENLHTDPDIRAQLVVVALDVAICAARYTPMRRLKSRSLTLSAVTNALLRGWSPRFRHEVEQGHARLLSQMEKGVAENALRDLRRQGINLEAAWRFATDWGADAAGLDDPDDAEEMDNPDAAPEFYEGTSLYRIQRQRVQRGGQRSEHLTVTLRKKTVAPLEEIIQTDTIYSRHRVADCWRLMLAGEKAKPARGRKHVTAGIEYNIATIGDETKHVIKLMEASRLGFNTGQFLDDYAMAEPEARRLRHQVRDAYHEERVRLEGLGALHEDDRPIRATVYGESRTAVNKYGIEVTMRGKVIRRASVGRIHYKGKKPGQGQPKPPALRALQNQANAAESFVDTFRSVRDQIVNSKLTGIVPIKTTAYKVSGNRRYETTSIWPQRITGRDRPTEIVPALFDDVDDEGVLTPGSPRANWFGKVAGGDLAGYDVSSSQTQLFAFLLGLSELESTASGGGVKVPFKEYFARMIWEARADVLKDGGKGYDEEAGDPRLIEAGKNLWMRVPYGSEIGTVVRDHRQRPEAYGPGWSNPEAVEKFLREKIVGYADLIAFLDALQVIGYGADKYAGITLVDPLDKADYIWNPIMTAADTIKVGGLRLPLYAPGRMEDRRDADGKIVKDKAGNRIKAFVPHDAVDGRYPVDLEALSRKICPCLVHSLDSLFASLVVKGLAARRVESFSSIHDCWLVGADQLHLLKAAIKEASVTWVAKLEPVYDRIGRLLSASGQAEYRNSTWEPARIAWEKRRDQGKPPEFLYKPSTLTAESLTRLRDEGDEFDVFYEPDLEEE